MRNQIRQRGGKRLAKCRRPVLGVVLVVALSSLVLLSFSFPAEGENYQDVQKGVQQSAQAALPSPEWEITLVQAEPSSGRETAKETGGETEAPELWTEADLELIAQTVWAEARGVESRAEQAAVVWCILNRVDAGTWVTPSPRWLHTPANLPGTLPAPWKLSSWNWPRTCAAGGLLRRLGPLMWAGPYPLNICTSRGTESGTTSERSGRRTRGAPGTGASPTPIWRGEL